MQDVATVGRPGTMRLPRWPVATVLTVALLVGILFVAFFAARYFTLNEQVFGLYWPKRGWLLLHIAGGIVALLTGPGQLWLGLKRLRLNLHRQLGVVYMTSVGLSSVAQGRTGRHRMAASSSST